MSQTIRKCMKRKSMKRKSMKRKSMKRKSMKRKSMKRKSMKRKSMKHIKYGGNIPESCGSGESGGWWTQSEDNVDHLQCLKDLCQKLFEYKNNAKEVFLSIINKLRVLLTKIEQNPDDLSNNPYRAARAIEKEYKWEKVKLQKIEEYNKDIVDKIVKYNSRNDPNIIKLLNNCKEYLENIKIEIDMRQINIQNLIKNINNAKEINNKNILGLNDFEGELFWLVIHIIYENLGGEIGWDKRSVISEFKENVLSKYGSLSKNLTKYSVYGAYVSEMPHYIYRFGKILFIFFNAGTPFNKDDVRFSIIPFTNYDKLVVFGHSMGAGLTYLFTTEIIENTKKILGKSFNFSNLYVYTTGLGRIPSRLADKFKQLHQNHKFKYIDLITITQVDTQNYYMDDFLDSIMITTNDCDAYSRRSPFYCKNWTSGCHKGLQNGTCKPNGCNMTRDPAPRTVELDGVYINGTITLEEKTKYSDCVDIDWGPIYGEKWNKCQEFYDKFHKHNEVKTFSLNVNTHLIESINKNELLKNIKVLKTTCDSDDMSEYHKFKHIYGAL
jgi:hypothetical protein